MGPLWHLVGLSQVLFITTFFIRCYMCNKIVLLSGGLDSYISYRLFAPDYLPVYVDTGSRYSIYDYQAALALVPSLVRFVLPSLTESDDGIVPHRNIILLAAVANHFNASEIMVAAPKGELVADQQPVFYRRASRLLGIRISNPAGRYTKTGLVKLAIRRGVSSTDLLATRSCYSAQRDPCGNCAACLKRSIAFTNNGIALGWYPSSKIIDKLRADLSLSLICRYGFSAILDTLAFFWKKK